MVKKKEVNILMRYEVHTAVYLKIKNSGGMLCHVDQEIVLMF